MCVAEANRTAPVYAGASFHALRTCMMPLRRLGFAFALALALLLGQQAATLHALGHAIEATQDSGHSKHPVPDTCEKCFAFAHLTGAAPSWVPPTGVEDIKASLERFIFTPAQSRTVVTARSRAPPSIS